MSYKHCMVIISITFLLSGIPLYADANVLTNPGFESGTSDWLARSCSIQAVTSPVRTGSMSGRAYNRTAAWNGIQQNMLDKMVIGETYTISGWVRTSSASSSTVKATVQQTDGNGTNYHYVDGATASNSSWVEVAGSFTLNVTGTLTELMVYFEGPDSGIDIYVDDAVVYGPEPGSVSVTGQINVNTRHQEIEGFGAAGAWYEGWLTAHPERETLYDIFFDQLGLDIYRLRNVYDQDGAADAMSQSGQIVAEAKERNPNLKILISSWSPPANLKSNGDTAGGGDATLDGGPSAYVYSDFADWWADSITAWSAYGVDADYISIQNEPDYDASWDSCRFDPTENSSVAGYNQAFEAVYSEMYSRFGSSMPNMLGPECIGLGYGSLDNFLNAIINHDHVYGYAHHLYHGGNGQDPDSYLPEMQDLNASWGSKPLFQTEYEDQTGAWPDAFNLALLLHNSLTVEEVAGYLYWDLFWAEPSGLVSFPSYGSSDYTINSDFYGFKHYSAFIHSGWQRIDTSTNSSDLRMSAYISPDDQELSVVIINTNSTSAVDADLSFTGFSILDGSIYRTSSSESCALVGTYNQAGILTIPANSVVTIALNADSATTPPSPPANLAATAGDTTVSLNWDDNGETDLDGYNVYRSTTSGSGYTKLNTSLLSTSDYTDNDVVNFTTYFYVVKAVDTDTNESGNSNEDYATPTDGSAVQLSYAGFESGFVDWVNVTGDDTNDWTRNSGGTSSSNTGPSGGANGSTWYVYLECSAAEGGAYDAGDSAILEGPEIDGANRELTFYYHMYGENMGTLNVDVFDGTWNNAVWSISGQQHASNTAAYTQAIVDLSAYIGPIRIRLRAVAAGGIRGDMAVDDIEVTGSLGSLYGDFTDDGVVDVDDLPEFFGYWLLTDCGELDLNDDCLINLYEFAEFAKNWLL